MKSLVKILDEQGLIEKKEKTQADAIKKLYPNPKD